MAGEDLKKSSEEDMKCNSQADVQNPTEHTIQKKRRRTVRLMQKIKDQMEFYFSDANLSKDRYMVGLVGAKGTSFVPLTEFLKFNQIATLTTEENLIQKAVSSSNMLELSEDKTLVKRRTAFHAKDDADDCTIYVENIPADVDHKWVKDVFISYGNVVYVSLPKFKPSMKNKGFAFVEFESKEILDRALKIFDISGCRLSVEAPQQLLSISTFTSDTQLSGSKFGVKRKQENDNVVPSKKFKKDDDKSSGDNELNKNEKTPKKRRGKKKKITLEAPHNSLSLRIMPKKEWKKLRNEYLNKQREIMSNLKKELRQFQKKMAKQAQKKFHEENDKETAAKKEKIKLAFVPGVIIKVNTGTNVEDVDVEMEKIKNQSEPAYIDINKGNNLFYIRYNSTEEAQEFIKSNAYSEIHILEGQEESEYWDKIFANRKANSKFFRKRGKCKLLEKADKILSNKHIYFEDTD